MQKKQNNSNLRTIYKNALNSLRNKKLTDDEFLDIILEHLEMKQERSEKLAKRCSMINGEYNRLVNKIEKLHKGFKKF